MHSPGQPARPGRSPNAQAPRASFLPVARVPRAPSACAPPAALPCRVPRVRPLQRACGPPAPAPSDCPRAPRRSRAPVARPAPCPRACCAPRAPYTPSPATSQLEASVTIQILYRDSPSSPLPSHNTPLLYCDTANQLSLPTCNKITILQYSSKPT